MNLEELIDHLLTTQKDFSKEGFVADEKIQDNIVALVREIKAKRDQNLPSDFQTFADVELRKMTASIEWMTSDLGCMLSRPYIECIKNLMLDNHKEQRHGALVEVGIWKGGLLILFHYICKEFGLSDSEIIGIDTFEGLLPPPSEFKRDLEFYELIKPFGALRIDQHRVKSFFQQYSVPEEKIKLIKSDICLPSDEVKGLKDISLLRIDVDFHNPTLSALEELYPKLINGGYVIVDDYGLPFDCKAAVDAFRKKHLITSPMIEINHQAIYWQK